MSIRDPPVRDEIMRHFHVRYEAVMDSLDAEIQPLYDNYCAAAETARSALLAERDQALKALADKSTGYVGTHRKETA